MQRNRVDGGRTYLHVLFPWEKKVLPRLLFYVAYRSVFLQPIGPTSGPISNSSHSHSLTIRMISAFINYPTKVLSQGLTNPLVLSAGVTATYLAFYTAYDKAHGRLSLSLLEDFLFVRKGWNWTLVEFNKILSLSGLTLLLTSFLPVKDIHRKTSKDLMCISTSMLLAHGVYSFYKFYNFGTSKFFSDKLIKQLSLLLGLSGQIVISVGCFGSISRNTLVAFATTFSLAHFWAMEVDYRYVLQVRPFAYLPFPLGLWIIYKNFFQADNASGK
jgi:hypothetical protein